MGVDKVRDRTSFLPVIVAAAELLLSPQLRGGFHSRCCRVAEEPHLSLDVLSRCCQEELLSDKLEFAEPQAAQLDLVLEVREQRFHLLSLSLCLRKLGRLRQLPCALSYRLMHVNGEILVSARRALYFL